MTISPPHARPDADNTSRGGTSLVSYTYNDSPLLHGLLAEIPSWTWLPDEIIIVDDGSSRPFELSEQEKELPIRILRNERNRGFGYTKSRGINAASHEYILSVDCDSRPCDNYLETCCLRLMADDRLGMVAGLNLPKPGPDMVVRYENMFVGDNYLNERGEVSFIGGSIFALRRSIWNRVGGFGDDILMMEDHALCKALVDAGFSLFVDETIVMRQARRLSRHSHCLRLWYWLSYEIRKRLHDRPLPEQFTELFLPPFGARSNIILRVQDYCLFYIEILYLMCLCVNTAIYAKENRKESPFAESPPFLLAAFLNFLAPYPRLATLIKEDLVKMDLAGILVDAIKIKSQDFSYWNIVLTPLVELDECGVLQHLDRVCVPLCYEEDATLAVDFSSYGSARAE